MTFTPGVPIAGDTGEEQPTDRYCRKCGAQTVTVRIWESSDGAYEDERFDCTSCGCTWWVDGIDS